LTTTATQTAEQITKQTQGAMENYLRWLQTAISALPWSNTNLNRIFLSTDTQNVTATVEFMHKLTQAKSFQDVVKVQTAKVLSETYAKGAEDAMKAPFGTRK
jgi:hypothetical protein